MMKITLQLISANNCLKLINKIRYNHRMIQAHIKSLIGFNKEQEKKINLKNKNLKNNLQNILLRKIS